MCPASATEDPAAGLFRFIGVGAVKRDRGSATNSTFSEQYVRERESRRVINLGLGGIPGLHIAQIDSGEAPGASEGSPARVGAETAP
jgi:hypothetical protein